MTATANPGTTDRRTLRAAAADRFTRALVDIASQGLRTHCSDAGSGELWLSEFEADHAEAARLCIGCPVLAECDAAAEANGDKFGVWGGKDRTPPKPVATGKAVP